MSKTDLQSNVDSIINTAKMESITNNNIESNLLSLISQILPAIQDLKSNITVATINIIFSQLTTTYWT